MLRSLASELARRGFTLIELLVSISIIGVLTGMMLANFRGGQKSAEIRLASDLLVSQIRAVQTSSYSGRLVSVCSGGSNDLAVCEAGKVPPVTCPSGTCQKRVPSGYGLHFSAGSATSYTLFYDTDDDKRYDAGEQLADVPFVSTGTVHLTDSSVGLPLDLVYKPPYGQLFVNGSDSVTDLVTLTLDHQFGGLTRHVNVYRLSGKVEHD